MASGGFADESGVSGDEEGGEGPAEHLQDVAGGEEDLPGRRGGGELAAFRTAGLEQWEGGVRGESEGFRWRAEAAWWCCSNGGSECERGE